MAAPSDPSCDLFVSYAKDDEGWVNGYLVDALKRAGVCIRSETTFALGAPRLLEFERAVQDCRRILLILSPAYLADVSNKFLNLLAQHYDLEPVALGRRSR